jgi:hypothetical protein
MAIDRGDGEHDDELASGRPDREASFPEFKYAVGAPGLGLGEKFYVDQGEKPSHHEIGLFDPGEHG